MVKPTYYACLLLTGLLGMVSFTVNTGTTEDELSPVRTPAQEKATFVVEPDLEVQLVAAEPLVEAPVVMTFDEAGRLWVVEMRGFMTNVKGEGEDKPVGRVSVLEDKNGDGQMDARTIYLDSRIMPRALALVPGGALVAENGALWFTKDTNNDLRADTKTLIDKNYTGGGLPEHAPNGLWQGMDNWLYNAKSRVRYRLADGVWLRDSTEMRGQWGICHDNSGRLFYNYNWSQLHADLVPPNTLSRNKHHTPTTGIDQGLTIDRRVYPIRANPAVNRGYVNGTLDKQGRLLEFTAACSPLVYRETTLPAAYRGNVFVCEPAGNLIKRNVLQQNGPMLVASDPHPGREFMASTDERFRPVSLASGPDGALYITDMYRGIIQHGAYMTPHLRAQTLARNLETPANYGRIWRVVPKGWKAGNSKNLALASDAELVATLSHPDGWHRDQAQRLLIGRQHPAIQNELVTLARSGRASLGRVHALWTLEGLRLTEPRLLLGLITDPSPLVQQTALRLLEPFAKTDPAVRTELARLLVNAAGKATLESALQIALTAHVFTPASFRPVEANPLLVSILNRYGNQPLVRDAVLSSLENAELEFLRSLWLQPGWQKPDPSREIFLEMLASALIRKRDPAELATLLELLDKSASNATWRNRAVLNGLAMGGSGRKLPPIKLAAAPRVLLRSSVGGAPARLASVTALFEWPGHTATAQADQKTVLLSEDDQKLFANGRQLYLSACSGCHGTDGAGVARFAPPLVGSDWVVGDSRRLALILLHGMEGPIEVAGKVYNKPAILPVMPAHSTMDDAAITAILTYIRNEWGNNAGPLNRRTVGMTRVLSQGRVAPWTASELNRYIRETREQAESGQ